MQDEYLRRRDVEKLTGFGTSSIYRLMGQGKFPLPYQTGARAVRWRKSDIDAWMEKHALVKGYADGTGRAAAA